MTLVSMLEATLNAPPATNTVRPTLTNTAQPTVTLTLTRTPTLTQTVAPQPSETAVPAQIVETAAVPPTLTPTETTPAGGAGIPVEAVVGGSILLAILGYIALYLRGAAAAERYAQGFVIDRCPVCRQGELVVETRQERSFGIPRPRSTVRCTHCRSLLREVDHRRWRYAVDPLQNSGLYERYNGREIDEDILKSLAAETPTQSPVRPRPPVTPPSFVDDEDQDKEQ